MLNVYKYELFSPFKILGMANKICSKGKHLY